MMNLLSEFSAGLLCRQRKAQPPWLWRLYHWINWHSDMQTAARQWSCVHADEHSQQKVFNCDVTQTAWQLTPSVHGARPSFIKDLPSIEVLQSFGAAHLDHSFNSQTTAPPSGSNVTNTNWVTRSIQVAYSNQETTWNQGDSLKLPWWNYTKAKFLCLGNNNLGPVFAKWPVQYTLLCHWFYQRPNNDRYYKVFAYIVLSRKIGQRLVLSRHPSYLS